MTQQLLFLNDCNYHEGRNPYATLVELPDSLTNAQIKSFECQQLGATRRGGNLSELLFDLNKEGFPSIILKEGRKSDFDDTLKTYKLISGNY